MERESGTDLEDVISLLGGVLPDSPVWTLWGIRIVPGLCAVCGVELSALYAMSGLLVWTLEMKGDLLG